MAFRPGGEEPAAVGFEAARSLSVRQGPAVGLKKAGSGLSKRGPSFRVLVPGGAVCGSFLALGISERGSGLVQVSLWHFPGHCFFSRFPSGSLHFFDTKKILATGGGR